jgi:putative nucleotidyltransferase with HDIG domain
MDVDIEQFHSRHFEPYVKMDTLTLEVSKRLEAAVERMPAFPKSVQKMLELTRDIDCEPKEIINIIEKDPVMTIKILRLLNSASYALPYKIISVQRAVVFLGLNTVKNLAISFASVGVLPSSNAAGFDLDRYLRHSLISAGIARQLAASHATGQIDPMDCYIAGLLHDFGKVVFAQFMAEEFREALRTSDESGRGLHDTEGEFISANHTVVGSMLAERWQFPNSMVDCLRRHHDVPVADGVLSECLYLANTISKKIEQPENTLPLVHSSDWRGKLIQLTVDEAVASLGDLGRFATEADTFIQTSRS